MVFVLSVTSLVSLHRPRRVKENALLMLIAHSPDWVHIRYMRPEATALDSELCQDIERLVCCIMCATPLTAW